MFLIFFNPHNNKLFTRMTSLVSVSVYLDGITMLRSPSLFIFTAPLMERHSIVMIMFVCVFVCVRAS